MTAGEWERIKSIFDTAVHIPASERSAWLEAACAGRPDLKQTVEQLLNNNDQAGDNFLEDLVQPSLSRQPSFEINQLVAGRFRVVRLIATGGMGELYDVFDERLGLRVALKTIRADLLASGEIYERFKREVWVTRDVFHEGICRVFELIEHRDSSGPNSAVTPCITMKLLDGRDLQTELRTRRPLLVREALDIIKQICSALQALHDKGIIHRDLKPSNIMLLGDKTENVRVVLTDFGLARPLDQTTLSLTNGAGKDQPGAPYFQAPEVLKGEKGSIASDIYALGLVIDELVTSSRAFTADSVHALYWQKIWEKPIPPSLRASGLPAHWEQVILKCLASDPFERYGSASEVLRDLERPVIEESFDLKTEPEADVVDILPGSWNWIRTARSRPTVRRTVLVCSLAVPFLAGMTVVPDLARGPAPAGIAVFPVVNESHRPDTDHLGQGIRAELLRRLRGVHQLHIFDTNETRASELVRSSEPIQFSLKTLLRVKADNLQLRVQLDDNKSGKTVWSRELQAPVSDSLGLEHRAADALIEEVQNQTGLKIAGISVAEYLTVPVVGSILRRFNGTSFDLPPNATTSSAAFQAYTRGRFLLEERTVKGALNALACFEEAVRIDSRFALAWAGMADTQQILMEFDHGSREDSLQQARHFAEQALAFGPNLPEVQATLGWVMQVAWEWERSAEAYRKSVELDPRFARGQRWYSGLLLQTGQIEEGLKRSRLALELDPWDYTAHSAHGFYLFSAGKAVEAARHLERTLAERDLIGARINLGLTYAFLAGHSEGQERRRYRANALRQSDILREQEIRGADPLSGKYSVKWADLTAALAHAYSGERDLAQPWLDRLEEGRREGRTSAVTVSSVYAALNEADRSLDLLEMAAAYHERELTNLRISPFFADLHGHPRFQALLKRIGLAPFVL